MHTIMDKDIRSLFAPTGTLRASINLGNPILANLNPETNQPFGISVDLATELAERLELPLELVVFDSAGKSVEAVTAEQADFGFFAVDPKRGEGIAFTAPYVLIEGGYLVRNESAVTHIDQVDRPGTRVVVGKGSAYDLFLSRELANATIERAPTSPTVVDVFIETNADVAAGVRQQLESDLNRFDGLRVIPGRFMVIQQAMGVPKGHDEQVAQYLRAFVEDMKASGAVQASMQRHGIQGAIVAPLA